jgi:2-polyprenyl-3-methyl-5-hydroxy-6-metoxy-1,4-benzoquinol methylase
MYVDFEDIFRGTREDIKSRQSVYLPYIGRSPAAQGQYPVLDIGCGRGEFLEILKQQGNKAKGVDKNPVMVERCKELDLDVELADGIEFLRKQKAGQYGAITVFHVIEHLPQAARVTLLDEALRVLRPGGLLILETPNPQNLVVGSCNFYLDPTHVSPIPPDLLRFVVEARGFVNAEIKLLHPVPDYARPASDSLPEELVALLYGPQDYSVIAWKA